MDDRLVASLGRALRPPRRVSEQRLARAIAAERRDAATGGEPRLGVGTGPGSSTPPGEPLEGRARWLLRGTSPHELSGLDPMRDRDRIHHHLSSTYRVASRVAETLSINRVACRRSLSLFLRSTGEAEHNARSRFLDTYALFANFFEWGADSPRGSAAVRRINEIHGRYYLPNDGMKYVLLNSAFTWLDAIDRIALRPLLDVERRGFFHAYVALGQALRIAELSHDAREMRVWFCDVNRRSAFFTPLKRSTFETFVKNSLGSAREDWLAVRLALAAGMDDDYRAALAYEPVPAARMARVRLALAELERRAADDRGAFVRSLDEAGGCGHRPPSRLGVSARSPRLPSVEGSLDGGGHPSCPGPVASRESAGEGRLPGYGWSEIRERVAAGAAWLVIDGEVHDVSSLIEHHPGGAARLRDCLGRDATEAFREVGHGLETDVFRLNYRVGRVVEGTPGPRRRQRP